MNTSSQPPLAVGEFEVYYVALKKQDQLVMLMAGPFIDPQDARAAINEMDPHLRQFVVVSSRVQVMEEPGW